MPQFDTSFLGTLIFWSLVSFSILMALLYKFAFPAIMETLTAREKQISGDIEKAEQARKAGEQLLADYQSRLEGAQREAHAMLEEAKKRSQEIADESEKRMEKEAQKTLEEARREIERSRQEAMKEVRLHVVDLVMETTTRVLQREVSDQDHRRMVEETLKQVGEAQQVKKG